MRSINSPTTESLSLLDSLLSPFRRDGTSPYRKARWLRSNFDDPIWIIQSDYEFSIDWRITLPDGNCLTSSMHSTLWEGLRSWLIARTHTRSTGKPFNAARTERNNLQATLHCIDYMLLRAEGLGLAKMGLEGLTDNALCAMVGRILSDRSVTKSVYEWPARLSTFFRARIAEASPDLIRSVIHANPIVSCTLPEESRRVTNLNADEIIQARAWLFASEQYRRTQRFDFSLPTRPLARLLYGDTLVGGRVGFLVPVELCLGEERRVGKEKDPIPVRECEDSRASRGWATIVTDSVCSLSLLTREGISAPTFEPETIRRFAKSLNTKISQRYRTAPSSVVLYGIERAVEFVLSSGDTLVDSYLNVVKAAADAQMHTASYAEKYGIATLVTPECAAIGVQRWTIEPAAQPLADSCKANRPSDWYNSLRANEGLWECIRVLYGAIQIIVGALTARRITELLLLNTKDCLSEGPSILFENGKSGTADYRERLRRPIPELAARAIRLLQRLQGGLIDLGVTRFHSNLFSFPLQLEGFVLCKLSKKAMCASLDYFCDWAEIPCDTEGRRYYLRQHQLRRFFAMIFFYGAGYGGLDTLRWFMGHTDARHVWHYISEALPGAVLQNVAMEWAVYQVKHSTPEAGALASELMDHFGTPDFSLLDEEALVAHLDDLMADGRLSIEPEFLDDGRKYRIAVVLRHKEAA